MKSTFIAVALVAAGLSIAGAAHAGSDVNCKMTFSLKGWSAFYQTSSGTGHVKCDNGQSARVKLSGKGGGLTIGKSTISDGVGTFSPVSAMNEIFGSYARAEAHAGAGESASAEVLTKGEVSLALSGKGHGVDLGVAFGSFTIEEVD